MCALPTVVATGHVWLLGNRDVAGVTKELNCLFYLILFSGYHVGQQSPEGPGLHSLLGPRAWQESASVKFYRINESINE